MGRAAIVNGAELTIGAVAASGHGAAAGLSSAFLIEPVITSSPCSSADSRENRRSRSAFSVSIAADRRRASS